jgi:ribosomal protein S18 acetylase RimI-like enzyme
MILQQRIDCSRNCTKLRLVLCEGTVLSMDIALRAATENDFAYCWGIYAAESAGLIHALNVDKAAQADYFKKRWASQETRIITLAGIDIGWLQTRPQDGALFLAQFFIDPAFQNRGIGTVVMKCLVHEAEDTGQVMTLSVVRINPAQRLYKRLGFYVTHEDESKAYMRCEPGIAAPIANLRA